MKDVYREKQSCGNRRHFAEIGHRLSGFVYWSGRFDYDKSIEETMEALHDLVKVLKSRSNWCICNVWLPVLQYAAYSKRTWSDTIFCNGESL